MFFFRERPPGNDGPHFLRSGLTGSAWGCLCTASPFRDNGSVHEAQNPVEFFDPVGASTGLGPDSGLHDVLR
eukprot:8804876-Prorocentrum_lima.AAC.1